MRTSTLAVLFLSVLVASSCGEGAFPALLPAANQARVDVDHELTVRFEGPEAFFTVRRSFRHGGADEDDELSVQAALPMTGVMTRFRVHGLGQWAEGRLDEALAASERYQDLTQLGEAEPRVVGLAEWSDEGVSLKAFPFVANDVVTFEYDVRTRARYEAGAWVVDYPIDEEAAPPRVHLAQASIEQEGLEGRLVFRARREGMHELVGTWARLPLGPDRTAWLLELGVAPELAPPPVRPWVVFVVDVSQSQGPEGISSQLDAVRAYLANAPDAQLELVTYHRFAQRLFGRFVSAGEFEQALAQVNGQALAPKNGSNLDEGALLAQALLSGAAGPARLVLFTDEQLRHGLSDQALERSLAALGPPAVAHVVLHAGGERDRRGTLETDRLLEHRLEPLASAHGGIVMRWQGASDDPEELKSSGLELVRPVRVEALSVVAPGFENDELWVEEALDEGQGLSQLSVASVVPRAVTVRGKIWARDVVLRLDEDPHAAASLGVHLLGDDDARDELSPNEVRTLAVQLGLLSSETSFLASSPGAAHSRLGRLGLPSFITVGRCGGSSVCGIGCRGVGSFGGRMRPEDALQALLGPGVARCQATLPGAVFVHVEWTGDEIVDVEVQAASDELAACAREVAWSARLGPAFQGHADAAVEFAAPVPP